ncbi:MAG TPA: TonB-dependent receptor [Albitalea sp.]|uniref:TonB-dependent receptor plug domain-containing protein n=1 Tax=Piscinibacter sp. TaxID=1903157 RepID=UPI002ED5209D
MKKLSFRARPVWLAAASSFLTICTPASSHAQGAAFELDPVTVTGSGTPRSLGSEIAATSVLTRADIERSGARDAVSVLNLLGTAQVEQQGGPGTLASVRIRGADTRDTLVLVDGVPLTDVTSGQALIQQIPADIIERVEVVRGNLSALYGANATGGVIQIFTRRARAGLSADATAGVGSRATRALSAGLGGGDERWSARLGVGVERTDGFSAAHAVTSNPDADGNRREHVVLAADAQPLDGHRFGLDLRHIDGRVAYDSAASFSAPTDTHQQHLVQTGAALRGRHALAPSWTVAWRWGQSNEKRTDSGTSAFGPFEFGNEIHNRTFAVDLNGELSAQWKLQAGVERLKQSTDIASYTRQSRDTDVLRVGSTYDADWGSLQANLRHDKTTDFGAATTGLLGGKLALSRGFSAIANLSTSFTPPTLDFLFFDCRPFSICSNPDLKPEKARNLEAGVQWQGAATLLRATAFAVRYRDKIANALRDPNDPASDFIPQNIGRAKNDGIEVSMRTTTGAWQLLAEATLQNPVNQDTGERLIRRARHQLALRADYQAAGWQAGFGLRHIGERADIDNSVFPSQAVTLPSATIVDASARWPLSSQWSVQASIENLFDRRYEPTANYSGRPRSLFVSASWKL